MPDIRIYFEILLSRKFLPLIYGTNQIRTGFYSKNGRELLPG